MHLLYLSYVKGKISYYIFLTTIKYYISQKWCSVHIESETYQIHLLNINESQKIDNNINGKLYKFDLMRINYHSS